jgi:riboflavin synthase
VRLDRAERHAHPLARTEDREDGMGADSWAGATTLATGDVGPAGMPPRSRGDGKTCSRQELPEPARQWRLRGNGDWDEDEDDENDAGNAGNAGDARSSVERQSVAPSARLRNIRMFTGIVQGIARVAEVIDRPGLRTFTLDFPAGFAQDLAIGASVSVDGVCLTVTDRTGADAARFDVMQQSLALTTLGGLAAGAAVNVERAARENAEIGGHPLSGHVDVQARLESIRRPENNHVLRISVPAPWMRYVFPKGYIAVNGASLTVAEADRRAGWFEVWLIPETLRMTTFGAKQEGDALNLEIERGTQVVVDTVRDAVEERLGPLLPALTRLLRERGEDMDAMLALPVERGGPRS